jgi:hypothetical protein
MCGHTALLQCAARIYCLLHHSLHSGVVGDRGPVGQRLATQRFDLVHHRLCSAYAAAAAVNCSAQIVNQHLGPALSQRQRMLPA